MASFTTNLSSLQRPLGRLGAAALAVAIGAAACSSTEPVTSDETDGPVVLATTSIWADVARNLACGPAGGSVESLLAPGSDPHAATLTLQDRERLEQADVVIANGLDLEANLDDLLDGVDGTVVRVSDHVETVRGNPHLWMDPGLVAEALGPIAEALIAAGFDEPAIEACEKSYLASLDQVDALVSEILASVSAECRNLVVNHGTLDYFARRYDLTIVGTILPGNTTLDEASLASLDRLAAVIEPLCVEAVFIDHAQGAQAARAFAERNGLAAVELHVESLGVHHGQVDSYLEFLVGNAEEIAASLNGHPPTAEDH